MIYQHPLLLKWFDNVSMYIANVYIQSNKLDIDYFPYFLNEEPSRLVGDLSGLGSPGYSNYSGRFFLFILGNEDFKILNPSEETHLAWGRLDYYCMFGECDATAWVETGLVSDHWALIANIKIQQNQNVTESRIRHSKSRI